nr:zf-HC2 domain-containing protein [candidate division Zixibacteria bacterium]
MDQKKNIDGFTMNCNRAIEYFDDYLANCISDADRERLQNHLELCAVCREELDRERTLLAILKSDTIPDPGQLYWDGLEQSIFDRVRINEVSSWNSLPVSTAEDSSSWKSILIPLAASLVFLFVSLSIDSFVPNKPGTLQTSLESDEFKTESLILNIKPDSDILGSMMMSPPGSMGGHLMAGHFGINL